MKRYIKGARKPRWWGSRFAQHVCDAYDSNEFDVHNRQSIIDWFTAYNTLPPKESDIKDVENIVKYYLYVK